MVPVLIATVFTVSSLASDLQKVARLPGEPSIVGAAGIDAKDTPILTLENASAFDPGSSKRRVVVVGSSRAAAGSVVAVIRWFKTSAPSNIRAHWTASALPSDDFESDRKAFDRWLAFQAPDIVVTVSDGSKSEREITRELQRALLENISDPKHVRVAARVGRDPLAIAKLLAAKYPGEPSISYIPALSWSNTLKLAARTNDAALRAKVDQQIQPWRTGGKELFGNRVQLTAVAGTLVFADLAKAGDEPSRALALKGAEAASKLKDGDLYEYGGGWTDDMFMASVVLSRTAALPGLPGREGDIDLAAKMVIAYAERLQRPDGLFNHATNGPAAWGRGNGFATLGLMEVLTAMPQSHPLRAKVLDIYRRHMEALRRHVAPDGMWGNVIDEPGSYREESATAIILTSMARGVRKGWLDRSYAPVVQRAWRGVAAHVAEDGTIVDVCTSTGSGPTRKYYLDRAAITGADDRGGAMALMAAMEMLEM